MERLQRFSFGGARFGRYRSQDQRGSARQILLGVRAGYCLSGASPPAKGVEPALDIARLQPLVITIDQQHLELANGQGRPAATPVAHRSVAALATRVDPPIPRYLGNPEHPARSRAPGRGPEWRDHYWLSCPDYSRHRLG